MATNFVSYDNATELMQGISDAIASAAAKGGFTFRGSVTFANLPSTLTEAMKNFVYNVTDDFTTDARFIEGAGKEYAAGTDVAVAELSSYDAVTPVGGENPKTEGWYEYDSVNDVYVLTEDETVDGTKTYYELVKSYKFDVLGNFIDVSYLEDMIANTFSTSVAYETGDVVIYQGALYKFKADHAAGAWDATEVDAKTVAELIAEAEPESLTTAQVNALLALLV